jgi:hypothetical protein
MPATKLTSCGPHIHLDEGRGVKLGSHGPCSLRSSAVGFSSGQWQRCACLACTHLRTSTVPLSCLCVCTLLALQCTGP